MIKKIILLLLFILIISGCNYKEINNYAIVSGISIDSNNNDFEVGVQIMNAKKDKESTDSGITFYKAKGETIYQALEKIMLEAPKELYLGHNEVLILSDKIVKEKEPTKYLDYFIRDSEVEKDSLVLIAKNNKALDILKIVTPLEDVPSKNIKSTLKNADIFSGSLTTVTIDEFISNLISDKKEAILPTVSIIGNEKNGEKQENIEKSDPNAKLKLGTLAFFKNNKLKGYLNADESTGYSLLKNNAKKTYINIKCDDENYATIRIKKEKIKNKYYFENKIPIFKTNKYIEASLFESNCKTNFIKSDKDIKKLEKLAKKKVNKIINETINKAYKENKSDILGLNYIFYSKQYNKYDKYKYNNSKFINNIKFKIDSVVKINTEELSVKSIMEED